MASRPDGCPLPSKAGNPAMPWPPEESLILVALMPSPRDLDIARTLGWYRIPMATAPRLLTVDYLAFYQPASFGPEHRWRIEYVAPLEGYELVTRRELFRHEPHHPRADQWYYKLQLGPLERLPRPIPALRWKRLTFLYTTGARLRRAQSLHDLVLRGAERETVWRTLRERAARYQAQPPPPREPPPDLWALLAGLTLKPEDDA